MGVVPDDKQDDKSSINTSITTQADIKELEVSNQPGLIVMSPGAHFGKKFTLDKPVMTLGRSSRCEIFVDESEISRKHVKFLVAADKRVRLKDLGSTNGSFVNQARIDEVELENGDQIRCGNTIFKFVAEGTVDSLFHEELYRQATQDPLTGIYNRKHFVDQLDSEFRRAKRYSRDLSLLMFDLDHFKQINDSHGHPAGDYVLKETARVIEENLRGQDVFCRYGGEEFAVLLPETNSDNAYLLAEKLRRVVSRYPFAYSDKEIHVTISLGVASVQGSQNVFGDLIAECDKQMYRAKERGRNRVCR